MNPQVGMKRKLRENVKWLLGQAKFWAVLDFINGELIGWLESYGLLLVDIM